MRQLFSWNRILRNLTETGNIVSSFWLKRSELFQETHNWNTKMTRKKPETWRMFHISGNWNTKKYLVKRESQRKTEYDTWKASYETWFNLMIQPFRFVIQAFDFMIHGGDFVNHALFQSFCFMNHSIHQTHMGPIRSVYVTLLCLKQMALTIFYRFSYNIKYPYNV